MSISRQPLVPTTKLFRVLIGETRERREAEDKAPRWRKMVQFSRIGGWARVGGGGYECE